MRNLQCTDNSDSPVRVGIALVLRPCPGVDAIGGGDNARTYQILIAKRMPNTPYAGYWEFPGGKVEAGESVSDAVVREVREEVGIVVDLIAPLPQVVHTYPHATVELCAWVCSVAEGSPAPRNIEVTAHRWVGIEALPWEVFLPANVRVVTRLVRWLESQEQSD